jgi:hypothetical protein
MSISANEGRWYVVDCYACAQCGGDGCWFCNWCGHTHTVSVFATEQNAIDYNMVRATNARHTLRVEKAENVRAEESNDSGTEGKDSGTGIGQ